MTDSKPLSNEIVFGAVGVSLLCVIMLLWPLLGHPPYSFFAIMRGSVAISSVYAAATLFSISRSLAPLSLLLVGLGALILLGKMRRFQWVPYDWAAVILFLAASGIMLWHGRKGR